MKQKSEKIKNKMLSAQLEKSINFYYLRSRSSSLHLYEALEFIDHAQLSSTQAKRLLALFNELTDIDSLYPRPIKQSKWRDIRKDSLAFLMMLAEKKNPNPVFNLAMPDGTPLSEEKKLQIKEFLPSTDFDLSFKCIELDSSSAARPTGFSPGGAKYYKDMEVPEELSVFIKESPLTKPVSKKRSLSSPHKLQFETKDSKGIKTIGPLSSDERSKVETFEFTVTREIILSRINAKRPCSQKKAFGNISALEYLLEIGMLLVEYQNGRDYHLAHRQAFSFAGLQALLNLDPMTKGANFATLFKVEEPIRRMLFGAEDCPTIDSVFVKGVVIFAKEKNVPHKIIYTLFWGDEHEYQLEIYIDPLSDRVPRFKENLFVKKLWALIMNIEFSTLEDHSESVTAPEDEEDLPALEPTLQEEDFPALEPTMQVEDLSALEPINLHEEFCAQIHIDSEMSAVPDRSQPQGFDECLPLRSADSDLLKPEAHTFKDSSQKITGLLQASNPITRTPTLVEKPAFTCSPDKIPAEDKESSFVEKYALFGTPQKPMKRPKNTWAYELEAEFQVNP